jgi:hypothetical protein
MDLPVSRYAGVYRLDDSIIAGVGEVLERHGLQYVPMVHCVLKYADRFFDLTAGNCHGKRKDITDMDVYFRAGPGDDESFYELGAAYYQRSDPALAGRSTGDLREIARACFDYRRPQNTDVSYSITICLSS